MTILTDPVTGEKLELYGAKGEDETVYRVDVDGAIANISSYLNVSRDEAIRLLRNSDVDDPIMYHDEAFWCE